MNSATGDLSKNDHAIAKRREKSRTNEIVYNRSKQISNLKFS